MNKSTSKNINQNRNKNQDQNIDQNMKLVYIAMFATVTVAAIFGIVWKMHDEKLHSKYYPQTLIVTETLPREMKAETATGIEYRILECPEDMEVGDMISAIMDKAETEDTIRDDIVVDWRYAGFFK